MGPLTDQEKELVEKFFATLDTGNSGYIDSAHAKGSSRLMKLIEGIRKHTKAQQNKVYLSDLMQYYANLKAGKINNGRDATEDVYKSTLEMMIKRVQFFQQGPSFALTDAEVENEA